MHILLGMLDSLDSTYYKAFSLKINNFNGFIKLKKIYIIDKCRSTKFQTYFVIYSMYSRLLLKS